MKVKMIPIFFIAIILQSQAQITKSKLFNSPGIYLGANRSKDTKIMYVPQAWFYVHDFYIETRYNYEDENTFSVHLGKPFEIPELKMDVTPTIGLVFGNFKGYSLGLNTEFDSRHLSGFTENQYCFSSINTNFFFSWAGFVTPVLKNLHAGASWQYTLDPSTQIFDVGPMLSFKKNIFEIQLFAYNSWKESRYWQLGVSFDLSSQNK